MKKLKCVFIDIVGDRRRKTIGFEENISFHSTFMEYPFNREIGSCVDQLFGWTTDLTKTMNNTEVEISVHIITLDYLRRHGVTQHFYSPHGPKFDDKYSYLHGANLLTFEGYNRVHLIYSIKKITRIFQSKRIFTSTRLESLDGNRPKRGVSHFFPVPVDRPRIGILTPTINLNSAWVSRLKEKTNLIMVSDDIRDLVPNVDPEDFVDYSLSRNYHYTLDDYIQPLNSILQAV